MSILHDSLLCPITLALFRNPVLAQDGHTYEREAIVEWIKKDGRSPISNAPLSLEHLYPNYAIKKAVDQFESSSKGKNYHYILNVDVKKQSGRPLFQAFGKSIYHAQWLPGSDNRPDVVLLKIDGARAKREASFYVDLSRHPHIVRTYGIVDERNEDSTAIMLLQEYASLGSLYDLLQDLDKLPDEEILIEMFSQITDAMSFLACNHVVHGDLACRNVLVFRFDEAKPDSIVVKVTDFGLSRHSKLYSLAPGAARTTLNIVPVRYVAPEILLTNATQEEYTEKSDVYSMGVLMWEAYSRGTLPWSDCEDKEIIHQVCSGARLQKPAKCNDIYWAVICKTWSQSPSDRPTFAELKHLLREKQSATQKKYVVSQRLIALILDTADDGIHV